MVRQKNGFTIVELVIVIVVIGVLAALVLNTFSQAQKRARDTQRRNDVGVFRKGIALYAAENGTAIIPDSGINGNGYGFINAGGAPSGSYSGPSIISKLEALKYFEPDKIKDPSYGASGVTAGDYMMYQCKDGGGKEKGKVGVFFVVWYPTPTDTANMTDWKNGSCGFVVQNDLGHMPYYNAVQTVNY